MIANIDEVVESNSTMIVMGSRGLTSLEGVFLGKYYPKDPPSCRGSSIDCSLMVDEGDEKRKDVES